MGLLHFSHSTAWNVAGLMGVWWEWFVTRSMAYRLQDRLVLLGDHARTRKNARRMSAVTSLHRDSETSTYRPGFGLGRP